MTNKEAKEKLYMEWQKFLENYVDYAGVSEAYKMAFKALDEQEPKWIPVSERLPKENGRYLCTVGTDYRNPREMNYEPKGKNNRTWASLDRAYVEDCFVIAWMPLPHPYKPQEGVKNEANSN